MTALSIVSCRKEAEINDKSVSLSDFIDSGYLRVLTIDDGIAYHCDEDGNESGYDYELSKSFAGHLNLELELIVAADVKDLMNKLELGDGDMIAYSIPVSPNCRERVVYAKNITSSPVVLVQKRKKDRVSDVVELIGKPVWTVKNGRTAVRLKNLDSELGGGIDIMTAPDSVSALMLIAAVAKGDIDYCLAEKDVVSAIDNEVKNLDCSLEVGLSSPKAWAFAKQCPELAEKFDCWINSRQTKELQNKLRKKYFSDYPAIKRLAGTKSQSDSISPFDDIFIREAEIIGWDWRLLASVSWNESRFNPYAESHMGAAGLMQMMPKTAARFGCEGDDILDPEKSVAAGVLYLKRLNTIFSVVESDEERVKFVLAGYNAGPGHIFDAMGLAEKYGADPCLWNDNVEDYLLKLNEEKYYNDSLCLHGFFRGKHTVKYVADVYEKYEEFCDR